MPTVVREGGLIVKVKVRDEHPPPHVHVLGPDWEARVLIGASASLWSVSWGQLSLKEANQAVALVEKYLDACHATWKEYHV